VYKRQVLALKKIFGGKSTFEKVGDELGRDFGLSLSEGLQHHIVNLAEDVFSGDRAAAMQAALGEITKEAIESGEANFDLLAEKAADTYSFIERGQLDAAQGQQVLNETVSQLLPHLEEMGETGTAQMERLLRAAKDSGLEFDGINEATAALAGNLITSAQEGGSAWLSATNEIGTTGRESLEFLKNEFGSVLPAEILTAIDNILNLNQTMNETTPAALAAADATDRLAQAAIRASEAARSIDFPDVPRGIGKADFGAAAGFRGVLGRDTMIQAHRGEFVNILSPAQTRTMDFAHAQNGMGPGSPVGDVTVNEGDTNVEFHASGNRKEDDSTLEKLLTELDARDGAKRRELQRMLGVKP